MTQRPADIVSPTSNQIIAPRVSADDARRAGRSAYDKPTADNAVMLFIDHQIGLMAGVRDFASLAEYRSNVVGLARVAKALKMPVLVSSSNAQWQNGDTLPELKELFVEEPIYRRTGIINCYEDPTFRKAFEDLVASTGRRHVIISGVTIGPAAPSRRWRCCTTATPSSPSSMPAARGTPTRRRPRCRA